MEKIDSFTIDHLRLIPGIYVSRKDTDPVKGGVVTTFDLRMTAPNREPVINMRLSIWARRSFVTTMSGRTACSISVRWVAAQASTFFCSVILSLLTSPISFVVCSSSWLHSKARFPVLVLRSAVTGTTPIWLALSGGRIATLPIPSPSSTNRTRFTLNCKTGALGK